MIKISEIVTLSSYEPQKYGIGHTVDGRPPKHPSIAESLLVFDRMIKHFSEFPTGTRIRVTMEEVKEPDFGVSLVERRNGIDTVIGTVPVFRNKEEKHDRRKRK